jgi:23S rRNA (cytosine1962-C5)-methyltransferase
MAQDHRQTLRRPNLNLKISGTGMRQQEQSVPSARLRLRVSTVAESVLKSGHPWLFDQSIREQNRAGQMGDIAIIYDHRDRFLGFGLFDPESSLRVRMLHVGQPQLIDLDWWRARLKQALSHREGLFDAQTNGYRCIHGESDGWPGLVLDRYDQTAVMKLYTAAWLPRLAEVAALIREALNPERLVLRLSKGIQSVAMDRFNLTDGQLLSGDATENVPTFLETGIQFEAEVYRGQKTGFFLDQRENRRRVESLVAGGEVLNLFSFTGGFSLYAARGGARFATDLDVSAHALASASRNFALNQANPQVAGCGHRTIQADAFEWLDKRPKAQFDLVISDPPSFARREAEKEGALAAYARLAGRGIALLRSGGVLVAASCSAHVSADEFFAVVRNAAWKSRRRFTELQTTGHPPDHPATFPEASYLKCIYFRLGGAISY